MAFPAEFNPNTPAFDCGDERTPQMYNRVTNSSEIGIISKQVRGGAFDRDITHHRPAACTQCSSGNSLPGTELLETKVRMEFSTGST